MGFEDGLRLGKGAIPIAFAGLNRHECHVGILLSQSRLDVLNPFILVGGAERGRDDREFAFAIHNSRGLVSEGVSYPLWRGLVDEKIARVLFSVRVPGNNSN